MDFGTTESLTSRNVMSSMDGFGEKNQVTCGEMRNRLDNDSHTHMDILANIHNMVSSNNSLMQNPHSQYIID